jgi:homoserine kinase
MPLRASIANIRSTAHLISCLVAGDFEHIKEGLFDSLHEQKRLSLIPIMGEPWLFLRDSHETWGVFLSGSGPTLAAFCKESISLGPQCVQILQRQGIAAQTYCLPIDTEGIKWICS